MSFQPSRRDFMKTTALTGVGYWVAGSSVFAQNEISANAQVNIASVGVGGKGSSDSDDAGRFGNLVAICDIDDKNLAKAAAKHPNAQKFNDFREMLDKMGDKIDAVTVSTPDHMHAQISLRAMSMGKHVFCQKPLTRTVAEARLMRKTAADKGVATQMGNQGTANNGLRTAVELVQSGSIGAVKEVHVWTNRPIWPQGQGRPTETETIPEHVHWDLWLGGAEDRPYSGSYHPFKWRGWWDFGTGALGDMACHTANMPFMALKLGYPEALWAETSEFNNETFPKTSKIVYQFPARGEMPPVTFNWYDGGNKPPQELLQGNKMSGSGALVIGDKGTIYSDDDYCGRFKLLPEDRFKDFKNPEPFLPRSPGHFVEWVNAIKGGPKAMSNFEYAAFLTEVVVLGNVAMRAKQKIEWDGPNMKATNCPEAEQYISPTYRKGWELPV